MGVFLYPQSFPLSVKYRLAGNYLIIKPACQKA